MAPAPLSAQHDEHGPAPAPDGEEVLLISSALGPYSRTITTDSEDAQAYFMQGMQLMYAFTPSDANPSFKEAQRHDPECAMCYFGEAWSLGQLSERRDASRGLSHRLRRHPQGQGAGRGVRHPVREGPDRGDDHPLRAGSTRATRQRLELDKAYAAAMEKVWEAHPEDLEVGTFYGESLMLLQPRRGFWDIDNPEVQKIHRVLEGVLANNIAHPGACHLYVHATEPTVRPEKAEACADHLGQSIPGAEPHPAHALAHTTTGWGAGRTP